MSDIIDVTPSGEPIYYDQHGRAMINTNGQMTYAPQYDRAPAPAQPASMAPQTQTYAPPAQQNTGNMLAFFTGGQGTDTSALPAYMLGADHESSMDGQDSTMVDTIRLDKRGDFVINMGGVALPSQRSIDVVILGCGPVGGRSAVYRTLFQGDYNENADAEAKKPVCWSYDNVTPAPGAPMKQHATCQGCPMDVKGSGPNNTRRCNKSQYLMVALASDLTKAYRIKISSKGVYSSDVAKNEYGLKPYATLLKSKSSNWEGLVTTMHCPDGLSGGIRFLPQRFLTEQEYKQAQELKMNLDISLYINLDADQNNVNVKMGDTVIGQVPAAQLGQVVQGVQTAVQQTVAAVQQQAQPVVQQPAPAAQVAQAQPAPAVQAAPVSFKEQLKQHPAFASLPQNVVDYVMHPGVDDATAQNYLAQYFPQVLAPVQPVSAPVAPVSPVAPAAVQPTAPAGSTVQPSQPVSPAANAGASGYAGAPTHANAGVQTAPQSAPAAAQSEPVMPAQPAEPTAPTEPAAAPTAAAQPAPNAVGVTQAQNVADLLNMI